MADSFVQVPPDSTGKQVDAASLPVGGQTVQRQRVVLGDNVGTATYATILSAGPVGTEGGLVVRNIPSGTQSIVGQVAVSGTIDAISAAVVLAAGTNNIGFINNISATVKVAGEVANGTSLSTTNKPVLIGGSDGLFPATIRTILTDASGRQTVNINSITAGTNNIGAVSLAAGTSNIGTINNISATVVVSGAVSLAAGANKVGFIGKISAGVVLAAGAANIGSINNISATVNVAGSLTIGGTVGATSYTAASSFTMIGGTDGSLARGMLMDSAGHPIISGTVALAAGSANIGSINNISATVVVSGAVSLATGANKIGFLGKISAGVVLAAGAANIGSINNISAAVVLAAGSANIGSINNISATVVVSGAVSLATGANKIGFVGKISAGVVLAAGAANIGSINNISAAVVLAAGGNNIGTINNISAAVVLAAGAANIGTINNISAAISILVGISAPAAGGNATVKAQWGDPYGRQVMILNHPSLYNTASHGPKCVTCSTSATVAIVAAPGAGLCVYITKIAATNGSATLTRGDVYGASATATAMASLHMAASGGGFIMDYDPPIKALSNVAVNCRVKPSVSKCMFNVHFYVGPK